MQAIRLIAQGSLSWREAKIGGKILRVDTEEKAVVGSKRFGENLLLYPASKVAPIKEPFGSLYTNFTRKLLANHTCFAIGFSFRDPYLNTAFADFLRRNRRNVLCIIAPNAEENLQNLFQNATPEEISVNVYQQLATRDARFESPEAEGMIMVIMKRQSETQETKMS
jgi:hypothetical protein